MSIHLNCRICKKFSNSGFTLSFWGNGFRFKTEKFRIASENVRKADIGHLCVFQTISSSSPQRHPEATSAPAFTGAEKLMKGNDCREFQSTVKYKCTLFLFIDICTISKCLFLPLSVLFLSVRCIASQLLCTPVQTG